MAIVWKCNKWSRNWRLWLDFGISMSHQI